MSGEFLEGLQKRADALLDKEIKFRPKNVAQWYVDELGLDWKELKGKKILDIGAGSGGFAKVAKTRGIDVVSVDKDPHDYLLRYAGKRPVEKKIPYIQADAYSMPFVDNSFDIVVSRASVHWMVCTKSELASLIREVTRVLKPGGEFRFTVGPMENLENFGKQLFSEEELQGEGSKADQVADVIDKLLMSIDPSARATLQLSLDKRNRVKSQSYWFSIRKEQ